MPRPRRPPLIRGLALKALLEGAAFRVTGAIAVRRGRPRREATAGTDDTAPSRGSIRLTRSAKFQAELLLLRMGRQATRLDRGTACSGPRDAGSRRHRARALRFSEARACRPTTGSARAAWALPAWADDSPGGRMARDAADRRCRASCQPLRAPRSKSACSPSTGTVNAISRLRIPRRRERRTLISVLPTTLPRREPPRRWTQRSFLTRHKTDHRGDRP